MNQQTQRFRTVKQVAESRAARGVWPDTESTLRRLIFDADTNGFSKCIRRRGRRVLIDDSAIDGWIAEGAAQ